MLKIFVNVHPLLFQKEYSYNLKFIKYILGVKCTRPRKQLDMSWQYLYFISKVRLGKKTLAKMVLESLLGESEALKPLCDEKQKGKGKVPGRGFSVTTRQKHSVDSSRRPINKLLLLR